MNINTASASKFMGNSEAIHTVTYQKNMTNKMFCRY